MADQWSEWLPARMIGRMLDKPVRTVRYCGERGSEGIDRRPAPADADHQCKYEYRCRVTRGDTPPTDYHALAEQLEGGGPDASVLDHMVDRWRLRQQHRPQRTHQAEFALGRKPIAIACLADQHIGSPGVRADLVVRDARLVAETDGAYACNLGDSINNFMIGRLAQQGALEDDSVEDQRLFLGAYLRTLCRRGSLLWYVAGNHELWTAALARVDPGGQLAAGLNVVYDKYEMSSTITVGAQQYLVHCRHRFKGYSWFNDVHANIRLYMEGDHRSLGDRHPDIVVLGHKHSYADSRQQRNGRLRSFVCVGSYKTEDSYGRAGGWQDALPYMPILVLHGDRRLIEVHWDLEYVCRELLPWLRR